MGQGCACPHPACGHLLPPKGRRADEPPQLIRIKDTPFHTTPKLALFAKGGRMSAWSSEHFGRWG